MSLTPKNLAASQGTAAFLRLAGRMPDLFDGIVVGIFFCVALAYLGPVSWVMDLMNGGAFAYAVPKFAFLCVLAYAPSQLLFEIRNGIRFGRAAQSVRFSMLTRAQLHYTLGVLATCAVLLPAFMFARGH